MTSVKLINHSSSTADWNYTIINEFCANKLRRLRWSEAMGGIGGQTFINAKSYIFGGSFGIFNNFHHPKNFAAV